jgi:lipooligosaccharide transport system permease protein
VWKRNLLTYQRIWKVNFITPLLEPLFYVTAFGLGFAGLIGDVVYGGTQMSYVQYIAPALLAAAVMNNAFLETTYASFVRMYYQNTFDGILATPISLEEVIIAEIVWAATKATGAAAVMLGVLGLFGLVSFPGALMILPLAFFGGLAFASVGMFFTGIIPTIDMFNLPVFLFITPMFLFSGTFFPVGNLPAWAQPLALAFPLHHLVELFRRFCVGTHETPTWISLACLTAFLFASAVLALVFMKRRLIQ